MIKPQMVTWSPGHILAPLLFLAFLAVYIRTAAPSVLSGDSAEFQFVAPLLGVAHPTTYPLYTLLGKFATLVVPFGDLAWRVTLVSALCAALAVALFIVLVRQFGLSLPAALVCALALGVAPGLWNAATLAEVYALLALLLVAMGLALRYERVYLAAFIAGLGFTHHGLFVITALPVFGVYLVWQTLRATPRSSASHMFRRWLLLGLCFMAGCSPWLYPIVQYARYGPFDGQDYGLPRHYYWGAPESWSAMLDLLTGGSLRRGIFRLPAAADALATLRMVAERMLFEFGPLGVALGLFGCVALARRACSLWLATAWVYGVTLVYLLLLGPAVADAPVFTLPMLLPWAVWLGFGIEAVLQAVQKLRAQPVAVGAGWKAIIIALLKSPSTFLIMALFAVTLAWADTRVEYSSKRHLMLYRTFGEQVLANLPPDAVVIAHWEQGATLQYLRLVEGQRPDVWVDVVEPSDEAWGARAKRRYAGREVYLIGQAPDVAGLPVELIREDGYALLFRLRSE